MTGEPSLHGPAEHPEAEADYRIGDVRRLGDNVDAKLDRPIDQEQRGNAERRAIFVGLWPPMLWLIGNALQQHEQDG